MFEDELISFLQKVIIGLKEQTLDENLRRQTSQLYMNSLFEDSFHDENHSEKEMINFLSLGWYIYNNSIKNT